MLNIVYGGGECPLGNADNTVVHVLRDETVEGPNDADHRNIDVGKNVCWRAKNLEDAHRQDEYGHDYECVRAP